MAPVRTRKYTSERPPRCADTKGPAVIGFLLKTRRYGVLGSVRNATARTG